MATDGSTETFQGRGSFFVLGDLKKNFFFQNVQHKIQFQNIYFFFFSEGRGTQKQAQTQKSGSENRKNDTKAGITRDCN